MKRSCNIRVILAKMEKLQREGKVATDGKLQSGVILAKEGKLQCECIVAKEGMTVT